jgi:hypothetical protein
MSLLERLARRWRRRWAAVATLAGAATGLLVGVIAYPAFHRTGAFAAVLAGIGIAAWVFRRRGPVGALAVARHLNRTVSAVEESADLLLHPVEHLSPLERLQRERVERRLDALTRPPRLPTRATYLACGYAAVILFVTAGLLYGGVRLREPGRTAAPQSPPPAPPSGPPRIMGVEVRLRPPGYTRRPERTTREWDLDIEEGARVTWRIRTDRPGGAVSLVTSDGDTLRSRSLGSGVFEVASVAEHSQLYQVALRDGATDVTSDYHRFTVVPDEPPSLTIVHPAPRTSIAPGEPLMVPLEVVAGDDYGVADASIVATVTAGSGEAVKFREVTLAFDTRTGQPDDQTVVLRRVLDLAALRMAPGDELYFYVIARDHHLPQPNTGRSDTYFISLIDTSHVVLADLSGLAVTGLPEYLRSERQIIIDTERLIAEAARLSVPVVRDRSDAIGFDQHALRDRYGEMVGDETVTQGTELTIEHEHDVAENTTLLAQSVKDKLQAALAQMWDAELRLRTYDPHSALPFEYRALDLLKQAQQATRVYVQRTGFEPPPLEPDRKRLTGTLTGVANASRQRTDTEAPAFPAFRGGLETAQRLAAGGSPRVEDGATLERAGREIARLAIERPGEQLETLRALRTLIASLGDSSAGGACRECAQRSTRGLWQALPRPDPVADGARAANGLAQTYFDLLRPGGKP